MECCSDWQEEYTNGSTLSYTVEDQSDISEHQSSYLISLPHKIWQSLKLQNIIL